MILLSEREQAGGAVNDASFRSLLSAFAVSLYTIIIPSIAQGISVAMTRRLQAEAELFGARLRELRQRHAMTQDGLASASGLTKAYISDMERGLTVPSMTTILRLALAIGCKPSYLMRVFDEADLAALLNQ